MAPGVRSGTRPALAALLALVAAVPFFGLIDLGTVIGLADPAYRWNVPLEASWGALFTFFLAVPYACIAGAERPGPACLQLIVTAAALAIAGVAGAEPRLLLTGVAVLASAALLTVLDPRVSPAWRIDAVSDRPAVLLAVSGLAVWLPYTLSALARSRDGADGDEVTLGISHWPVQGAVGIALVLAAVAMVVRRPLRILRVTVVLTGALLAGTALAYPDRLGATEGSVWAVLALVWTAAVAAAPLATAARSRTLGAPSA